MVDYYVDMSAGTEGKISGLKTPLLAVLALDDPIVEDRFPLDEIADNDHLFFLLTRYVTAKVLRGCSSTTHQGQGVSMGFFFTTFILFQG